MEKRLVAEPTNYKEGGYDRWYRRVGSRIEYSGSFPPTGLELRPETLRVNNVGLPSEYKVAEVVGWETRTIRIKPMGGRVRRIVRRAKEYLREVFTRPKTEKTALFHIQPSVLIEDLNGTPGDPTTVSFPAEVVGMDTRKDADYLINVERASYQNQFYVDGKLCQVSMHYTLKINEIKS